MRPLPPFVRGALTACVCLSGAFVFTEIYKATLGEDDVGEPLNLAPALDVYQAIEAPMQEAATKPSSEASPLSSHDWMPLASRFERLVVFMAGVEGTGHHLLHQAIYPALVKHLPEVYHDKGFFVLLDNKPQAEKVFGISSFQDFISFRHNRESFVWNHKSRAEHTALLLNIIAEKNPSLRCLMVDSPSYPAFPELGEEDVGSLKAAWNNPDVDVIDRAARLTKAPGWSPRIIVMVRNWVSLLESVMRRDIRVEAFPNHVRFIANELHTAMVVLNAQVAALNSPWAVLDYDRIVEDPRKCSEGMARFLRLDQRKVEPLIVAAVAKPSSTSSNFSQQEIDWIKDKFESKAAEELWPVIARGRRERALC